MQINSTVLGVIGEGEGGGVVQLYCFGGYLGGGGTSSSRAQSKCMRDDMMVGARATAAGEPEEKKILEIAVS